MEWLKRKLALCAVAGVLLFSVQPLAVSAAAPEGQVVAGFAAQLIQNNGTEDKPQAEDKTLGERLAEEISSNPVIFGLNVIVFAASIAAGYKGYREIKE